MGCSSSKRQQAILEPVVAPAQSQTLLSQPEEIKTEASEACEQAKAETTSLNQAVGPDAVDMLAREQHAAESTLKTMKVQVLSVRGLRNADWLGNSEVFVEVSIVGKPGPASKTLLAESSKDDCAEKTIKAVFEAELEVKDYSLGDAVAFVVKDKDILKDDILGRAVLSEEQLRLGFDGELPLTGIRSEGQAFVRVKVEPQASIAKEVLDIVVEVALETLETVERWCCM